MGSQLHSLRLSINISVGMRCSVVWWLMADCTVQNTIVKQDEEWMSTQSERRRTSTFIICSNKRRLPPANRVIGSIAHPHSSSVRIIRTSDKSSAQSSINIREAANTCERAVMCVCMSPVASAAYTSILSRGYTEFTSNYSVRRTALQTLLVINCHIGSIRKRERFMRWPSRKW